MLAEVVMHDWKSGTRFMDIGTGTGVQGVFACKAGFKEVISTDVSPCAVYAAKKSLEESCGTDILVHVVQCDLLSCFREGVNADVIAFNPPYLREDEAEKPYDECLRRFIEAVESGDVYELVRSFAEQAKRVGFKSAYLVISSLSGIPFSRITAMGFTLKASRKWFFEEVHVLALEEG